MPEPLEIDGRTLEGGGQLIRLSVGLAAITGTSIHLINIRGKRPRGGGLKAQHLTAIEWLGKACGAALEGAAVKSQSLVIKPDLGSRKNNAYWWDSTAVLDDGRKVKTVTIDLQGVGAVTLVLQAILPFILLSGTSGEDSVLDGFPVLLTLKGGTNVSFSPSVDYAQQVLFPNLRLLGLPSMELSDERILRRAWHTGRTQPGEATFLIMPVAHGATLQPLRRPRRGRVNKIDITILASGLMTRKLVQQHTTQALSARLPGVLQETVLEEESGDPARLYVLLVAHTDSGFRLGRDQLYEGRIGKTSTAVENAVQSLVHQVVDGLLEELHGDMEGSSNEARCLDSHMEDQVCVYMALASGTSQCERVVNGTKYDSSGPSLHTKTAQWVVEQLLGVSIEDNGECNGVGMVAGDPLSRETKSPETIEKKLDALKLEGY